MSLMPPNIETAFSLKNLDRLEHYKVNMCIECGCCAYICPAKRRLVQVMQLSKELLWKRKQERRAAQAAAEAAAAAAAEKAASDAVTKEAK